MSGTSSPRPGTRRIWSSAIGLVAAPAVPWVSTGFLK